MVIATSPWASSGGLDLDSGLEKKKSGRDDRRVGIHGFFFTMIAGFVYVSTNVRRGISVIISSYFLGFLCERSLEEKYFATKGLRSIGVAFVIRDEEKIVVYKNFIRIDWNRIGYI